MVQDPAAAVVGLVLVVPGCYPCHLESKIPVYDMMSRSCMQHEASWQRARELGAYVIVSTGCRPVDGKHGIWSQQASCHMHAELERQ